MKLKKEISIFFILGLFYLGIELFSRAGRQELVGLVLMSPKPIQPLSLAGWTSIWMLFVGGFAAWSIGFIDTFKSFAKQKLIIKILVCGLIITATEFFSGLVLNIYLELALWDYSHVRYNLLGQITIRSATAFTLLGPLVLWLNNFLRYKLFDEPKRYRFPGIYWDLIRGK
jgi:hypothetical protein